MSESLIIIDTSLIREGKGEELKAAMQSLVAFAEANEPRMIAYRVYLNEDETLVTVIQVHPDAASADFHMTAGGPAFSGFKELVRMEELDIYGSPGPELLDKLQQKARMLGPASVAVHSLSAGFTRFEIPSPR
jgi:quinol monooxygenase YgiN